MVGNVLDEAGVALWNNIGALIEEFIKPLALPICIEIPASRSWRNKCEGRTEGLCNLLNIDPVMGSSCWRHFLRVIIAPARVRFIVTACQRSQDKCQNSIRKNR